MLTKLTAVHAQTTNTYRSWRMQRNITSVDHFSRWRLNSILRTEHWNIAVWRKILKCWHHLAQNTVNWKSTQQCVLKLCNCWNSCTHQNGVCRVSSQPQSNQQWFTIHFHNIKCILYTNAFDVLTQLGVKYHGFQLSRKDLADTMCNKKSGCWIAASDTTA